MKIKIDKAQSDALRAIAERRDVSLDELVYEMLAEFIEMDSVIREIENENS